MPLANQSTTRRCWQQYFFVMSAGALRSSGMHLSAETQLSHRLFASSPFSKSCEGFTAVDRNPLCRLRSQNGSHLFGCQPHLRRFPAFDNDFAVPWCKLLHTAVDFSRYRRRHPRSSRCSFTGRHADQLCDEIHRRSLLYPVRRWRQYSGAGSGLCACSFCCWCSA